jgi:undecaprenyldiphospho-muramoylpentapeptide beta-N-acetylglucosaminyltransferase
MKKTIVLAGGGTAGHVKPMLALADYLPKTQFEVRFIGTEEGLESDLVPGGGYSLTVIPKVTWARRPALSWLSFPSKIAYAINLCEEAFLAWQPQVLVGFGGYVSLPAYFAARRLRIPIVIHEQNSVPGWANKTASKWASRVCVTFDNTQLSQSQILTGLPLGDSVVSQLAQFRYRVHQSPAILVVGGSLGALSLNLAFARAAAELPQDLKIFHLTGRGKIDQVKNLVPQPIWGQQYIAQEFTHNLVDFYTQANLVVARAGAGMVNELSALGLPSIFVPFPYGNGEQKYNAQAAVNSQGALMVEDKQFTPDYIQRRLFNLARDEAALLRMSQAIAGTAILNGTENLAREVLSVI